MRVLPSIRLLAVPVLAMLAASCTDMTQPTQPGPAVQFLIVSGQGQSGIAGQELPAPIKVQATDINNVPVPNTVVNFVVTAGGGSVFAGASLTDANGFAADIWRLGPVAGSAQTLEVRSVDPSGTKHIYGVFTATAGNSAPTTIVKFDGDGQSAAVGTAVAIAPAVRITDQIGNPVSGQSVTFSVASGGGGVTGASAVTDGSGVARVGSWTLGGTAGPNTLTATAASLPGSPLTFSATATGGGGDPGSLAIATAPSSTVQNGVAFPVQPAIQLLNDGGAPLAQAGVQVTASVSGGGAAASGTTTALTDATGKATFTGLSLTGVVGSYVVTFSASGFNSVNSASINLTAGAAANIVVFSGNGQSASAGTAVPILPSARVTDISGNPVQGVSVTFAVTQGGGSVSGPAQTTGANGVATVGSWTLGPVPGPNGLSATATGVGSPAAFTATGVGGNVWSSIANAPLARRYSAFGVLNGIMYLAGGRNSGGGAINTFHAYDPATNTWATKTHSIAARVGGAMVPLNGKLYLLGGSTGSGAQLSTLATTEVYDPVTNAWTSLASMPEARDFFAAGVVNGIIYVTGGGAAGQGIKATTYSYDPATNVWTQRASLPAARSDISGAGLNGLFYIVGGTTASGVDGRILSYNPLTDSWTMLAAMSTKRTHVNAELVNGLIYSISGQTNGVANPAATAVEAYDPATNTWSPRASMLASRYGSGLGVIGGVLYVAAGYSGSATLATAEKYVP